MARILTVDQDVVDDPYVLAEELRRTCPVYRVPVYNVIVLTGTTTSSTLPVALTISRRFSLPTARTATTAAAYQRRCVPSPVDRERTIRRPQAASPNCWPPTCLTSKTNCNTSTPHCTLGDGMDFFGRYIEVTPPSRIVWTNEEGGENGSVTTVTFEEKDGRTKLVMSELYRSKEALDAEGGAADATHETFGQLDELLTMMR